MTDRSSRAPLIHCHGASKQFGPGDAAVPALRGVDLDVGRGELLLLVGPSGCGKTTLLSVIGTMLDRDGGECEVMGRGPAAMSATKRAGLRTWRTDALSR